MIVSDTVKKSLDMKSDTESAEERGGITFWTIVMSTLAAAFGVQSRANRERDFQHGNIWVFIAAGIIFTVLFVTTIFTIVQFILPGQAG